MTLQVTGLSVRYDGPGGAARAVDGASFGVDAGQTVALVGESGCGKTTAALAIASVLQRFYPNEFQIEKLQTLLREPETLEKLKNSPANFREIERKRRGERKMAQQVLSAWSAE
jgi:ABC-type glutathione transport system ATPase component